MDMGSDELAAPLPVQDHLLEPTPVGPMGVGPIERIILEPGDEVLRLQAHTHQARRRATSLAGSPDRARGATHSRQSRALLHRAFARGALVGLVWMIPALAILLHAVAHWGTADVQPSLAFTLSITAGFAGLPAMLLAGGTARWTLRVASRPGAGSPGRAIRSAVLSTAVIGIGLGVLAAVPLRCLPQPPANWIWVTAAGILAGAMGGFLLGYWVIATSGRRS